MQVAFVLYPGLTALDAIGPYELLKFLPGVEIRFVGHKVGPVATDRGVLHLGITHSFEETPAPHLVLVPGSEAQTAVAAADTRLTEWLKSVHQTSRYTTSVCSGAIILAASGVLSGQSATTHWAGLDSLRRFGVTPRPNERIVRAGKIWTAAGVSAGLDLALALIEDIAGQETAERIQLLVEYDPQPPFESGHMDKATAEVANAARKEMAQASRSFRGSIAVSKLLWREAINKTRGQRRAGAKRSFWN